MRGSLFMLDHKLTEVVQEYPEVEASFSPSEIDDELKALSAKDAGESAEVRRVEEIRLDFLKVKASIQSCSPAKLKEVTDRLKLKSLDAILSGYVEACLFRNRLKAFLFALELTFRKIAPAFRNRRSEIDCKPVLNDREWCDLVLYDAMWLAVHHASLKEFKRLEVTDNPESWIALFGVVERILYKRKYDKNSNWRIVQNLKVNESQQWECRVLKSKPVKRTALGLGFRQTRIFTQLLEDMPTIQKRGLNKKAAEQILLTRKKIWVCAEMCEWKPTRTAMLYRYMTGEEMTKSTAADQISKIARHRHKKRSSTELEECELIEKDDKCVGMLPVSLTES